VVHLPVPLRKFLITNRSITKPGGENIFPKEIEEHLLRHPQVVEASVIGIPDPKYGEAVGCFLRLSDDGPKPRKDEIQNWVRAEMGRSKTPQSVFWVGPDEACSHIPQTGSGKHQEHVLRQMACTLLDTHVQTE
jgi:acyl-CoA synthetase (AMP-forming)/AMP-acid ligase II